MEMMVSMVLSFLTSSVASSSCSMGGVLADLAEGAGVLVSE